MKKQTAGMEAFGDFAPKFAQLNDDVLFGEVWSREDKLSPRDRSLVTVVALVTIGITGTPLQYHMGKAKENGITKVEITEALTQLAFYSGWPKVWTAMGAAKEIWAD